MPNVILVVYSLDLIEQLKSLTFRDTQTTYWSHFVDTFARAFVALRRLASILIHFCTSLFHTIPKFESATIEKWMSDAFMLSKSENEAIDWLRKTLHDGKSWMTSLKDLQHDLSRG
jgi:hypothetical protein